MIVGQGAGDIHAPYQMMELIVDGSCIADAVVETLLKVLWTEDHHWFFQRKTEGNSVGTGLFL